MLTRALEILRSSRESPARDAKEFALLAGLISPIIALHGFAAEPLAVIQTRALHLAASLEMDPPPQLLRSLALSALCREEFEAVRRYGRELQTLGRPDGADGLMVEGEYVLGVAAYWQGELAEARRHFETAIAGHRPERRRLHIMRYGYDPEVVCTTRLACTLWFEGDAVAAVAARDRSLALIEEVRHRETRVVGSVFLGLLSLEMGDVDLLRRHASSMGSDAEDPAHIRIPATLLQGYVRILDGERDAGISSIRSVFEEPLQNTAPGLRAVATRFLLAACRATDDGPGMLAAAGSLLEMGGSARLWESEARRSRAEALVRLGGLASEVEGELAAAIDVAQRQGAHLLEQKAIATLRRYRLVQGTVVDPPPVRTVLRERLASGPVSVPDAEERLPERFGNADHPPFPSQTSHREDRHEQDV
jgi:hypothetical protein